MGNETAKLHVKYDNLLICSKINLEWPLELIFITDCVNGVKLPI